MDPPPADALAAVFGRTAPTYDTVIPFFATFGRRLVELAAVGPGERVLDVACGRGASLFPAAEAAGPGGSAVGVDLSDEMVEAVAADATRRSLTNVEVRRMDAQDLAFPDASFDVVLCGFSLWLVPDPGRAAAEMRRVLRPGGRCAVSQPTGAGPDWDFFGPLVGRHAARATRPLSAPRDVNVADVLVGAGFDDIAVHDVVEHFVLPDEEAWWRWAWSTGQRAVLEAFPPDALDELKAEAFAHLRSITRPDGLHLDQRARYAAGHERA